MYQPYLIFVIVKSKLINCWCLLDFVIELDFNFIIELSFVNLLFLKKNENENEKKKKCPNMLSYMISIFKKKIKIKEYKQIGLPIF